VAYAWTAGSYALKLAGNYSYRSTYESWLNRLNVDGGTVYDIPAYWLAHARVEVARVGSPWLLTLSVQNLFDKQYELTRNFFGNRPGTKDDLNVAAAGQPRSFGVTLSYAY
jgi:outer membrane receptor protein involved in Fe transport